jgi:hypothetical protein
MHLFLFSFIVGGDARCEGRGVRERTGKLGTVAFANSCAPAAEGSFQRGVALLHSFWFAEGDKAFREALDRDPGCAIATWGIATILVGNTFTVGPSPAEAQRAREAIDLGRMIGAKTQREHDYIEAIAAYYDHFAERPNGARMRSLSDAFETLAARYPDDDETQIFDALYLAASQSLADKSSRGPQKQLRSLNLNLQSTTRASHTI